MCLDRLLVFLLSVSLCSTQDHTKVTPQLDVTGVTPSLSLEPATESVYTGEEVTLHCQVDVSTGWEYLWYKDSQGTQLPISGISYTFKTELGYAGTYWCRVTTEAAFSQFSSPVSLIVNASKPKPQLSRDPGFEVMYVGESVTFTCKVDVSIGWEYLWYKDSQGTPLPISDTSQSSYTIKTELSHAGTYWCRVRRGSHQFHSENSVDIRLKTQAVPVPSLELLSGWLDVFPSERVELRCGVQDSSDWTYTWTRGGQKVGSDQTVSINSEGATLSIVSAEQKHSGEYSCLGQHKTRPVTTESSKSVSLSVYDEKPKPQLSRDPGFEVMYVGESVTFTCKVDVSTGWEYLWYKDSQGTPLPISDTSQSSYTIKTELSHAGTYWCRVRRGSHQFHSENSVDIRLKTQAVPVPSLELLSGWLDVFPSERVELRCGVQDSSDWTYTWTRGGQKVGSDQTVSINSEGATLSIVSAEQKHSGEYSCLGQHKTRPVTTESSKSVSLSVYDEKPKPQLSRDPGFEVMYVGESVTFTCKVDVSTGWEYLWYKGSQGTPLPISDTSQSSYTIKTELSHAGTYWCRVRRGSHQFHSENSVDILLKTQAVPVPSLELLSGWLDVFPSERVELRCGVQDSSDWTYMWTRGGQKVGSDQTVSINSEGATLSIVSAEQKHSGEYSCLGQHKTRPVTTESSKSVSLSVYASKPKPQLTLDPGFEVMYVGESVTFTCKVDVSTGWEYLWYKDSQGTPLPISDTSQSSYTIKTELSHAGTYWCRVRRGSHQFHSEYSVDIRLKTQAVPVPSLDLLSGWLDVFPSERVELRCGVQDSSDWTYMWTRGGQKVGSDQTVSINSEGATLSIVSAEQKHSGEYSCLGQHKTRPVTTKSSKSVSLSVYDEKPKPQLSRDPGFEVMYVGESVTFTCKVNVSTGWEYLWYKDSQGTPLPISDTSQSSYTIKTELSHAGTYWCRVRRGSHQFHSENSVDIRLKTQVRPWAEMTLETGWTDVFYTDSLVLRCEIHQSSDQWNYTWYREEVFVVNSGDRKYTVTPQEDPDQSQYSCEGQREGRPSYSTRSEAFKTRNLALKRKVLLSISGCLFFGLIIVFIGCVGLRLTRKPETEKTETENLFLSMAQLKSSTDTPSPLNGYILEADDKVEREDKDEVGICDESTPLPIFYENEQVMSSQNTDTLAANGGMVSFMSQDN
ncbi:Fc receptor-like protein 5 [Osmerus mordax]|uniref:Fc receptor-like protein 5 n=1 Tax=Osmerus mordax TaxID=8014 RepID=UPI003510421D